MEIKLFLRPEWHEPLLKHAPKGSLAHGVLTLAVHLDAPSRYVVTCDMNAAQIILRTAGRHCKAAARSIRQDIQQSYPSRTIPGRPR